MKTLNILEEMTPLTIDPVKEVENILGEEKGALTKAGFKAFNKIGTSEAVRKCKRSIYSEKELRRICLKYDFRFLPVKYWEGIPDVSVGREIVNYKREKREQEGNSRWYDDNIKFRILAPTESFNHALVYDPILLARVEGDTWEFVCQWGKDMRATRALIAFVRLFTLHDMRMSLQNETFGRDNGWSLIIMSILFWIACSIVATGIIAITDAIFHVKFLSFLHVIEVGFTMTFGIIFPLLNFFVDRKKYWNGKGMVSE